MSEDMDDVRRALTIVFRGADGLARPDVERAFSFDMEWVAPHEAEDVVNALLAAGWLEERGAELHLAVPLGTVDVPFGWFPRPTRLLRPVPASSVTDGSETAVPSPTPTTAPSSGTASAICRCSRTHPSSLNRRSPGTIDPACREVHRSAKRFGTRRIAPSSGPQDQGVPTHHALDGLRLGRTGTGAGHGRHRQGARCGLIRSIVNQRFLTTGR